jgi:protease-4
MSTEKKPILTALIILGITILFLGMVMTLALKFTGSSSRLSFSNKIGVIPIEGSIDNSSTILNQLVEFREDRGIKAIILRINSPGGGVADSQEIYREVRKTREEKIVVVSIGGMAASGGYYIASAGEKIVASPGTITGSIGAKMEYLQYMNLLEKIGISPEIVKSGEFKDMGSSYRDLTDREKELLEGLISDILEQFIEDVAVGRNLSAEKVRQIADGRILTGAMAKELGLVDQLGNFRDAVDLAKEMSGIEGEVNLIYPKRARIRLMDYIFQGAVNAFLEAVDNMKDTKIEYKWDGIYN